MTTNDADYLDLAQVLDEEYAHLHPETAGKSAQSDAEDRLSRATARMRAGGHAALCLSGGGIRSASFALGVMQRLADRRILDKFDYLSTVSGGGFIGGWLSAWMMHLSMGPGAPSVCDELRGSGGGSAQPEPATVTQVRRYSRYLAPRAGLASSDVWTILVTIVRNLVVNWFVLMPLVAAALLVPRVYVQLVRLGGVSTSSWWWGASAAAAALLAIAVTYVRRDLPSLGNARRASHVFLAWCLVPVSLAQILLSLCWAWQAHHGALPAVLLIVSAAAFCAGAPWLIAAIAGHGSRAHLRMWAAAATTGAATTFAVLGARQALATGMLASPVFGPRMYAVLDVPIALAILVLGGTVFAGLASRDMSDDDREWWARAGAWLLIVAAGWMAVSALVLFSLPALEALRRWNPALNLSEGWGQVVLSVITLLIGNAAADAGRRVRDTAPSRRSIWQRAAFAVSTPAFALGLFVALAAANEDLLDAFAALGLFQSLGPATQLAQVLALMGLLLVLGLAMDYLIDVNRFSLHGMYRDRLIRTFLGASRPAAERHPHRFTGFDSADNMPLHALSRTRRPLHLINATLNDTGSNEAGWQERRARPFTFSPLHCGSATESIGFRRAESYAGGVTLGGALAVSGAAVSSSMGDLSSPPLTFLLTMFNARLGVWLGNPNNARTWRHAEPTFGAASLVDELVGRTTSTRPYVYLTDGEHFENLGLYEIVRRRCRYVVVSDAGCDPLYQFADLGNAIRKIRIDFGIPIEFPSGLTALTAESAAERRHIAIGRIGYSAVDGSPVDEDGVLVYIKPVIVGDEPADVVTYRATHAEFPHQSTADQWFGETDFEAYRALGWQSAESIPGPETTTPPSDGRREADSARATARI